MTETQDLATIMKQRMEQKENKNIKPTIKDANKGTNRDSNKDKKSTKGKKSTRKKTPKKPESTITVNKKQLDEFIEKQLEQDKLIKELMKKKKDDGKIFKLAKMAMKAIYNSNHNRYQSNKATGLAANLEILKEFFDV